MLRVALGALAAVVLVAGGVATGQLHGRRADTFISLWPACACGKSTSLQQFSLSTGKRLGSLARVQVATGERLALPPVRPGGPVLLTFSSGPRCAQPAGGGVSFGPCVAVAYSCASRIESVNPATGAMKTVLALPASMSVTDAVPSPDGRMVAMRAANCQTSFFDQALVVRDLSSGRQWSIGADAVRCHELLAPSWSADGSRLVFPYGPSVLPRTTKPSTSQFCSAPRYNRLVVVASRHASSSRSWHLIAADPGCSFEAAAFDRQGIAAAEGCKHGAPRGSGADPSVGDAYLLQLGRHNQVIGRVALKRGWEEGLVSREPRTGNVLVSQDQPANQGYPERDWVWQFDGHTLRLVGSYAANDAAQVLGVPW